LLEESVSALSKSPSRKVDMIADVVEKDYKYIRLYLRDGRHDLIKMMNSKLKNY